MKFCDECGGMALIVEQNLEIRNREKPVETTEWRCLECGKTAKDERVATENIVERYPDEIGRGVSTREGHPLE